MEAKAPTTIEISIAKGIEYEEEAKQIQKLKEKKLMNWVSIVQNLADVLVVQANIRDGKGRLREPILLASAGLSPPSWALLRTGSRAESGRCSARLTYDSWGLCLVLLFEVWIGSNSVWNTFGGRAGGSSYTFSEETFGRYMPLLSLIYFGII
ncbi:hypothetical protein AAG906_038763 [Vitis piasezkii]